MPPIAATDDENRELPPKGREEVRIAILAAANELFGQKGPDAVSVREVAKRAQVNHGLLHRHFGAKEQLLREVIDDHARAFATATQGAGSAAEAMATMFDAVMDRPAFARMFAHLLLTGHPLEEFVRKQGGTAALAEKLRTESEAPREDAQTGLDVASLTAAMMTAASLGWSLYEQMVLHAVGQEDVDAARRFVRGQLLRLMEQPQGK